MVDSVTYVLVRANVTVRYHATMTLNIEKKVLLEANIRASTSQAFNDARYLGQPGRKYLTYMYR
jgi:hypothetical protein